METVIGRHILEQIAEERHLEKKQMALLLGFSRQYLDALIKMEGQPTLPLLDRISKKLHIPWRDLVDNEGNWKRDVQ